MGVLTIKFGLIAAAMLLFINVAQAQEARPLNDKAAARAMTGVYKIDSVKGNTSGCTDPQVTSKPGEPYMAVHAMRVQKHIQVRLRPRPDVETCLQWAADPWNAGWSKGMLKQPRAVYTAMGTDGALVGEASMVGCWDEKAKLCLGAELAVSTVRIDAKGSLRAESRVYRFDAPAMGPEAPR